MARSQYYQYIQKYFPKSEWDRAYNVMMGESGGRADAVGDNYPIRGQTIPSYGPFQIRALAGRPSPSKLLDPEFNVKYAANMQREQGWGPWTVARKLGYVGTTPSGQVAGSQTVKNTTMDLDKVKQFYKKAIGAGYDAKTVNAYIKGKLKSSKEETEEVEEKALEAEEEASLPPEYTGPGEGIRTDPDLGETVSERDTNRAIMALRREIQKPENFQDLMRRYGKTFGGPLEDYIVREEYNKYQGEKDETGEDRWGEAKESEKDVEAMKGKGDPTQRDKVAGEIEILKREKYTIDTIEKIILKAGFKPEDFKEELKDYKPEKKKRDWNPFD